MEGLRGLAILLVFVCHYNDIIAVSLPLPGTAAAVTRLLGTAGGFGVDLFFLLSGFLIYRTTLKPALNVGSFLLRRAERIYPAFIAVFAVTLALETGHHGPARIGSDPAHGAAGIVANLLFLPGMFDMPAVISAAWSLSYEWFYYLVLPLTVLALQFHRWSRSRRVAFLAGLSLGYEGLCLFVPSLFPTFANFEGSHVRLLMFVSGMLVYELLESERFRRWFGAVPKTVAVGIAGASAIAILIKLARDGAAASPQATEAWSAHAAAIQLIPTFVGFAALGLVVLRDEGRLARMFSATWLRWTGNISYSFYLVHSLPMHAVALELDRAAEHVSATLLVILGFPVALFCTYLVSALLFWIVEKPLSLRPSRAARARAELQIA